MPAGPEGRATGAREPSPGPAGLSPTRLGAWTAELLSVPGGLLAAYGVAPRTVDPRTREQLIVAVAEANGARSTAWVHGAWLEFLGARDPDDVLAPLFDYAAACARAGVPLDATTLEAAFPPELVRSVRATVAVAQLSSLVGGTADELWARLRDRSVTPRDALGAGAVFGLTLPLVVPAWAFAGMVRVVTGLAPPLPAVDLPPPAEANLAVHLLAEALPSYLGHVLARTTIVWWPVPVAVAFRMEGTSATLRMGRGRLAITNGVEPDAVAVLDGGVEPLLQLAAGAILREMGLPVGRGY